MSLNYTENRIKEALRLSNGNPAKARRQIFAWMYEDHKLLLDVTRPHLTGIVAYAVDRVLSRLTKTDDEILEETAKEAELSANKRKDSLGREILKGFASGNAPQFGHEADAAPLRRTVASQNHIDTIHLLAASSRKKRNDQE